MWELCLTKPPLATPSFAKESRLKNCLRSSLVDAGFQPAYFLSVGNRAEIIFDVEPCAATGGYVARWDNPGGGGITTQGDSFGELDTMIADAVSGYFEPDQRPRSVRLHFSQDPILAMS
jgi:hypothetical protein